MRKTETGKLQRGYFDYIRLWKPLSGGRQPPSKYKNLNLRRAGKLLNPFAGKQYVDKQLPKFSKVKQRRAAARSKSKADILQKRKLRRRAKQRQEIAKQKRVAQRKPPPPRTMTSRVDNTVSAARRRINELIAASPVEDAVPTQKRKVVSRQSMRKALMSRVAGKTQKKRAPTPKPKKQKKRAPTPKPPPKPVVKKKAIPKAIRKKLLSRVSDCCLEILLIRNPQSKQKRLRSWRKRGR